MTIDYIKLLCDKKEQEIKENFDNSKDIEKIKLIREFLEVDNCFLKVSANEALNILLFLGIKKENLRESYLKLISFDNYNEAKTLKVIG